MRKILIIILMAVCIVTPGMFHTASAFTDVLDMPAKKTGLATASLYNGVALAGKRIVAVGQYGYILYSDDGGKSWTQADVPVSSDLTAVAFPTQDKGWAVGHDGVVLHSADGGVSWIKQLDGRIANTLMLKYYTQNPPQELQEDALALDSFMFEIERFVHDGPDQPFLDVFFEDENNGFIVGAFNLIFKTSDGGKNWVPWYHKVENPDRLHMYSIRLIDGDIFISGEQGLLLQFDRSTSRFSEIPNKPYEGTLFGIEGKPGVMVIFGMRGHLFRSEDKGNSWEKVDTGLEAGLTAAAVSEDGKIFVASQGGDLLVGEKNCTTFKKLDVGTPFSAASAVTTGSDKVVIAGFGGLNVVKLK